jgi:hypothetical protein
VYPSLKDALASRKIVKPLSDFLAKDAALSKAIADPRTSVTLFAPTEAAFKALEATPGAKAILANPTATGNVLAYHVVPGARLLPRGVKDGEQLETMYKGNKLTIKKVRLSLGGPGAGPGRAGALRQVWMALALRAGPPARAWPSGAPPRGTNRADARPRRPRLCPPQVKNADGTGVVEVLSDAPGAKPAQVRRRAGPGRVLEAAAARPLAAGPALGLSAHAHPPLPDYPPPPHPTPHPTPNPTPNPIPHPQVKKMNVIAGNSVIHLVDGALVPAKV